LPHGGFWAKLYRREMADDNDIDAGWDDIDAGSEAEAKPSANERITAESDPLPTMISVPTPPEPKPEPEPPRELFKASVPKPRDDEDEDASFTEDDVTANRLYDDELLAEAIVTIEPLTDDNDPDDIDLEGHHEVTRDRTAELMEGRIVPPSNDTVRERAILAAFF
jgi:hypothetical protein